MRLFRFVAISTLICSIAICPARAATIFTLLGYTNISGEIKPGDYDKLVESFADRTTPKIIISSPGGNVAEALKMAELIRTRHASIEVSRFCISACASFLFVAAAERSIDRSAFVAFHAGTEGQLTGALPMMQARRASDAGDEAIYRANIDRMTSDVAALIDGGRRLRAARGVSEVLHDAVLALTSPAIQSVTVDDATRDIRVDLGRPGRCEYWVADAAGLAEVGIDVKMTGTIDRKKVASMLEVDPARLYLGRLSDSRYADPAITTCTPDP